MALHCHSGAPAPHMPRLLADGVGAGSECDRHGHCRGGKRNGHPAICPRGREWPEGELCVATPLHCPLAGFASLQILFSLTRLSFLSLFLYRFVLFSKDDLLLGPILIQLLTLFLESPCTMIKQTNKQKRTGLQSSQLTFVVPNRAMVFPLESENFGGAPSNPAYIPKPGAWQLTGSPVYQLKREHNLLFLYRRPLFFEEREKKTFSSFAKSNIVFPL